MFGEGSKMNKKTTLSIVLTLLMIASAFSAVSVNAIQLNTCSDPPLGSTSYVENLDVTKQIWNGTAWVDEYTAEVGETVNFKIKITYHEVCGYKAKDIVVTDNMDFIGDLTATWKDYNPVPDETGTPTVWNLTDELWEGQSVKITFNVTITSGSGELINTVQVHATETCCGGDLYGEDSARIIVEEDEPPCEPEIEVTKKVWNGTGWDEYVDGLILGDIVKFKIEVLYTDCDTDYEILNMEIRDNLPCCLIFDETLDIYTDGEMDEPTEEIMNDGEIVFWNWTFDRHVVLHDGDTLTIEFQAEFVEYCECISENWAYVTAWGCSGPTFEDEDNAEVDCTMPETTFEKLATDDWQDWRDEINTTTMAHLAFKLELVYHGESPLTNIRFVDVLPCILEYNLSAVYYYDKVDNTTNLNLTPEISSDGKTIWWNITNFELLDGEKLVVYVLTKVTGTTGDCCQCEYVINHGSVTGDICQAEPSDLFMEDEVIIRSSLNCPPDIPDISGPTNGKVGEKLFFNSILNDPNDDQVYYKWYVYGANVPYCPDWLGPYNSRDEVEFNLTFESEGTYEIYVQVKDEHGLYSTLTDYPLEVTITEEEPQEEIELTVDIARLTRGAVVFSVINKCDIDLEDATWEIDATVGLLDKVKLDESGTFDIDGLKTKHFDTGENSVEFGFGILKGSLKLSVEDYEKTTEFKGLLIGKIVIILSQ